MSFLDDGHEQVYQYLPDMREIDKVSREWICNVISTVLEDEFVNWVSKQVQDRNVAVVEKNELAVEMDPDIYAAFMASTAVSRKY